MRKKLALRVLIVTEGSGGHLIPAAQLADALVASGSTVQLWYAARPKAKALAQSLFAQSANPKLEVVPLPWGRASHVLARLMACARIGLQTRICFKTFEPDVVVGFGGWVTAPVILSAKLRWRSFRHQPIPCVVHEQNVKLGRANRWLAQWVDCIAASFEETRQEQLGKSFAVTGLPIRQRIGRLSREQGAKVLGIDAQRPTILILGGSQGARSLDQIMVQVSSLVPEEHRKQWQFVHLSGHEDESSLKRAYENHGLTARVLPFLAQMEAAYAVADLVLARAGASTIAELACCGTPAILVPYPYAGGHQRFNAHLVEALCGGIVVEQAQLTPQRVLVLFNRILQDHRLRTMMGIEIHRLHYGDAQQRLCRLIYNVANKASSDLSVDSAVACAAGAAA